MWHNHMTQPWLAVHPGNPGFNLDSTMDTYTRYTRSRKLITEPSMSDISGARSTRSLRSQVSLNNADIQASTQATSRKAPTKWTDHDETLLIQFLATKKAEAGDTFGYQRSTFNNAAVHINQSSMHKMGVPKSGDSCKTKWGNVSSIYYESMICWLQLIFISIAKSCLLYCCRYKENFRLLMEWRGWCWNCGWSCLG